MSSKLLKIGSLLVAGTLASIGATARAGGNINTSGVICRNFVASEALDIDYQTIGVQDVNAAARRVICSVPRSPLSAGSIAQFFVDGHNNANTCTTCTLTVYPYNPGNPNLGMSQSQTFSNCAPAAAPLEWDQLVSFPTIMSPGDTFEYASLLCIIPGNRNGTLYGVTALQP
jgi:hypothetical protein